MAVEVKGPKAVVVGFGGYVLTGYIVTDNTSKRVANVEAIPDEEDDDAAELYSNRGDEVTFDVIDCGGSLHGADIGDAIDVDGKTMGIRDIEVRRGSKARKLRITAGLRGKMTYT